MQRGMGLTAREARHSYSCVGVCVVGVLVNVRILAYHTSITTLTTSNVDSGHGQTSDTTLHHGRNPQPPMSWQQGLCPALPCLCPACALPVPSCPPVFCSSREITAPKLHGVASTILLIKAGVC